MEKEQVKQVILSDGKCYTGWGYHKQEGFIPDGCGKKYYDGYYAYGNFINGIIDNYYGTFEIDDKFASIFGIKSEKNQTREQFRDIPPIIKEHNYFEGVHII